MSFSNLLVACLGARASLSGPRQLSTDSLGRTGWHKVCRSILRNDSYFPFIDKHLVKDFVRSRVPGLAIARELQYFDSAAVTSMTRWPQIDDGGRTHLLKATHLSGGVMLVQPNSTKCLKVPCRLGSGRKLAPGRVVTGVAQSRAAQLASCRHWNTFSYGKQTRETVLYSRVARGCLLERAIGGLTAQRDMKLFVFGGRLAFVKTYAKRFQECGADQHQRRARCRLLFIPELDAPSHVRGRFSPPFRARTSATVPRGDGGRRGGARSRFRERAR